eukprot:CAMPEP_0180120880 /NCGR_PEP_ID=MMETSP0986-20121125/2757_1 /TAXON_ID=697907 /ORGANISM="non described non described, Strain CCMP2293" /LENGTH=96 /DNA_ID=CAMNT_0022059989 /DNA_START=144 /DNA_END=433 /DNA_ORIENTATION=-
MSHGSARSKRVWFQDANSPPVTMNIAAAVHVARDEEDGEKVVVLPAGKLERMYVDRVEGAARGRLLPVVMLVDKPVDGAEVEESVEVGVEEVVDDE